MIGRDTYRDTSILTEIVADLTRLGYLAEKHGKWVVVVIFPYEYQLRRGTPDVLPAERRIMDAGGEVGIAAFDLYDGLKSKLSDRVHSNDLYLYGDPMHFSPVGHGIVADLVERILADNVFADATA